MALLRKDLKIGFLAGALLLVLAVGYALVLTFTGPDATQGSLSETPDLNPAGPADPPPTVGEDASAGAPPAAGDATLANSNTKEWDVYGVNGKEPSVTETPTRDEPVGEALPDAPVEDQLPQAPNLNNQALIDPPVANDAASSAGTSPASDGGTVLPLPEMPAVRTHVVQNGDNFSTLAEKYYGDPNLYTLIQKANPKVDSRRLKLGQALFIPERPATRPAPGGATQDPSATGIPAPTGPEAGIHVVASGETLAQIAQDLLGSELRWDELYKLNRDVIGSDPARLKVGMKLKLPK